MVCTPCMTYFGSCLKDDRASLFQTGYQNYKKASLSRNAKSQVHLKAVARAAADSAKPGSSQGDIALKMLSKSIRTNMRMLFRDAHAIAKKGRPYTDFTWMAALDEKKGLDVGQTYRSDKCCREFIDIIADATRKTQRVRKGVAYGVCGRKIRQTNKTSLPSNFLGGQPEYANLQTILDSKCLITYL